MHEWALAEAVVSSTSEAAEKGGLREITEVKIRLGELQQIEPEVFLFALSQLKSGKLKNAKFEIQKARAKMKCRGCGNTWVFDKTKLDEETVEAIHFVPEVAHTFVKCPRCGSSDFEVVEGRGVWLVSVKGVK